MNFLKKQNRERGYADPGRTEFARLQREAIENYLVGLIRAVVRSCMSAALGLPIDRFGLDVSPYFESSISVL